MSTDATRTQGRASRRFSPETRPEQTAASTPLPEELAPSNTHTLKQPPSLPHRHAGAAPSQPPPAATAPPRRLSFFPSVGGAEPAASTSGAVGGW